MRSSTPWRQPSVAPRGARHVDRTRPERLRTLVSIDYHAISTLRATLPLRNLDAFHEAFGIREGDPMWRAPDQRVRIW